MKTYTECSCGLLAFDPVPCEQCANPDPDPDGIVRERKNTERLCMDCRSSCGDCKDTCCHDHKDPRKPLCNRCRRASEGGVMRTLYLVSVCDEDVGEAQGMFDERGKLIDAWSDNDACWRTDYFSAVAQFMGFGVEEIDAEKKHIKALKKHFGL